MRPMKLTHSLRIEQKEIGLSAPRGYACMLGSLLIASNVWFLIG
jgi:hypothetical protein